MNDHQLLAIKALNNMKSDDTIRAMIAFKNCTPEEMNTKYGQSSKTRNQILEEYEKYDEKVDSSIIWIKNQKS